MQHKALSGAMGYLIIHHVPKYECYYTIYQEAKASLTSNLM